MSQLTYQKAKRPFRKWCNFVKKTNMYETRWRVWITRAGLAVKLRTLRWLLTRTTEMGMACSRWTDRLTIAIEGGAR
ncbi:MAG: hypothetical protein KKC99_01135 [Proteobacteria bacterium]|nr:hypothetical protein [Pseudomonadota bacterium]